MSVRRITINSVADFEAMPEGEWFYAPRGIGAKLVFDDFHLEEDRLTIRLPAKVARRFKQKKGRPLKAHLSGDQLIVER